MDPADETAGPLWGADRPGQARCVLRGRRKDRSTDLLFLLSAVLLPLAIKESRVLVAGSSGNSKSRAQSRQNACLMTINVPVSPAPSKYFLPSFRKAETVSSAPSQLPAEMPAAVGLQ